MRSFDDSYRAMIAPLFLACAVVLPIGGCRVLSPAPIPVTSQQIAQELIDTEASQIEIGKARPIIDRVGWVVGIPGKLLLWDRRVDRHKISESTLLSAAEYLEFNNLPHVKVRANQYAPLADWKRLKQNKTVAWPYRYSLGLVSLAQETVLPGRIFGGDHFNPYTQTIHLYSDVPAIALHEAAHAKDFTRRKYQGSYALAYAFLPLWHETIASEDVFAYLDVQGDSQQVAEADRILYPAYATYVGGSVGPFFPSHGLLVYYGAVAAGHLNGRMLARADRRRSPGTDLIGFKANDFQSDALDGLSKTESLTDQMFRQSGDVVTVGYQMPNGTPDEVAFSSSLSDSEARPADEAAHDDQGNEDTSRADEAQDIGIPSEAVHRAKSSSDAKPTSAAI